MNFLQMCCLLVFFHGETCFSEKKGTDICKLKVDIGPCLGLSNAWHYDEKDGECKRFTYGGCLGNENRFKTKYECEEACLVKRSADTADCVDSNRYCRYWARIGECTKNSVMMKSECPVSCGVCPIKKKNPTKRSDSVCVLKPDAGDCSALFTRWYHDPITGTCKEFTFTGCNGNKNNFETKKLCEERCVDFGEQLIEG